MRGRSDIIFAIFLILAVVAIAGIGATVRKNDTGCGPAETYVKFEDIGEGRLGKLISARPSKQKGYFCVKLHTSQ